MRESMETHSTYPEFQTARQWAIKGFLPNDGAEGRELWSNQYCRDKYVYYSPEDVSIATKEQISEFFKPERDRKNELARKRRQKRKQMIEEAEKQCRKEYEDQLKRDAVQPYLERISQLQRIIKTLSSNITNSGGSNTIVIDTETTGLDPDKDELLQVSIIDVDGNKLFDSYFKPCVRSWDSAQTVNGISPEMVQDAPRISEKVVELNCILHGAERIIGYNTNFDLDFLEASGLSIPDDTIIIDVMADFAPIYGEYSEKHGGYKWQKLITAASYFDYDWNSRPHGAHNSLADCYATLYVYKKMLEQS